ncbi:hypothetical protein H4Q26_012317 [Puccinia striiformis f. sp. tritici PST-130]|nr:hypothetical protein H4Q26_012317 [Puccinia striiformis f. sp. tritici PST-130]
MSKPNNTNTTQPSYIPPSPDPRFVETPEFYPPCERCSNLELVCGQSTKAAVTEDEREVRQKVWTDPKTGETSVYPYTAVESPPQSTPNDKELIELEQETAAPWVTGKKAIEPSPSDLSVHSPRFALLQAARRGKSKRTREQLEEDEILQDLENLGGGFLRNNVEEEDFEEVKGVGNERGQETTWKGIANEEEEVLEIDEGFVVAEKQVRLDANEVPEEKDRLFNWSSDDEEEIDVLRKSKEELKSKVISIGEETAKAVAKLMKMIPKGLKEEAKIVRRDLAEAVEGKIKDANKFLEKEF